METTKMKYVFLTLLALNSCSNEDVQHQRSSKVSDSSEAYSQEKSSDSFLRGGSTGGNDKVGALVSFEALGTEVTDNSKAKPFCSAVAVCPNAILTIGHCFQLGGMYFTLDTGPILDKKYSDLKSNIYHAGSAVKLSHIGGPDEVGDGVMFMRLSAVPGGPQPNLTPVDFHTGALVDNGSYSVTAYGRESILEDMQGIRKNATVSKTGDANGVLVFKGLNGHLHYGDSGGGFFLNDRLIGIALSVSPSPTKNIEIRNPTPQDFTMRVAGLASLLEGVVGANNARSAICNSIGQVELVANYPWMNAIQEPGKITASVTRSGGASEQVIGCGNNESKCRFSEQGDFNVTAQAVAKDGFEFVRWLSPATCGTQNPCRLELGSRSPRQVLDAEFAVMQVVQMNLELPDIRQGETLQFTMIEASGRRSNTCTVSTSNTSCRFFVRSLHNNTLMLLNSLAVGELLELSGGLGNLSAWQRSLQLPAVGSFSIGIRGRSVNPSPTPMPTPTPTPPIPTPTPTPTVVPIQETAVKFFRMRNPNTGVRFHTTSRGEAENVAREGWLDETSTAKICVFPTQPNLAAMAPVNRLYNLGTGYHFYTTNSFEALANAQRGWIWEKGVPAGTERSIVPPSSEEAWVAYENQGQRFKEERLKPIYRFNSLDRGYHLYTSDANEVSLLNGDRDFASQQEYRAYRFHAGISYSLAEREFSAMLNQSEARRRVRAAWRNEGVLGYGALNCVESVP
jgi:hypothetical protein